MPLGHKRGERMNKQALRTQYNTLLNRYKAAEAYIDNPTRTAADIQRWMPEFLRIVKDLNLILARIGPHTASEAVHGFKEANAPCK